MSIYKTPLRYPGGKSKVADYLVSLFPEYKEYREPFLGGGSVFLTAKGEYPEKRYWINDLYYDLYCFWLIVSDTSEDLTQVLNKIRQETKDGKELYNYCISRIQDRCTQFERALYFFIINRITFSGTSLSGGYSVESFEKRFTQSSIDRIISCAPALEDNVMLTCEDYSKLLKKGGDGVFVFLDPPYYSATDSALYGKNGELHKGFDHERFRKCVGECQHKFLITYDDCPYIRELYKDFNIRPFEFAYGMRNVVENADMTGKELIITNYDILEPKSVELF